MRTFPPPSPSEKCMVIAILTCHNFPYTCVLSTHLKAAKSLHLTLFETMRQNTFNVKETTKYYILLDKINKN